MDINFVIWGAGFKGRKLAKLLTHRYVKAIIDSDTNKQGKELEAIPIIGCEEYFESYRNLFIIISNTEYEEIERILIEKGIHNYFILSECPSEFLGYGIQNLDRLLDIEVDIEKVNLIWGSSLYSILLYKRFEELGCKNLTCIPHDKTSDETRKCLKDILKINIGSKNDICTCEQGSLYLSVRERCREAERIHKLKKISVHDLSDMISEYYNEDIVQFKNKHGGKRCFIVATGPSLKVEDVETLRRNNAVCFGVNGIYNITGTDWKPDYYVVMDHMVICKNIKQIMQYDVGYKFINDCAHEYWAEKEADGIKLHAVTDDIFEELPDFSENIPQKVYTGATVVYACIQIAVYMGFSEIYLLGVDCNYSMGSLNNYFFAGEKNDYINHRENRMINSYISAKKYADSHGIKIYNATRGGMLEVFERVNFDTLF